MVDGVLLTFFFLVLMKLSGSYAAVRDGSLSLGTQLLWSAVSFSLWFVMNGYYLHTRGQSVGKIAMKIKIVRADGTRADLFRLTFMRMLPVQLVTLIPAVGGLLNLVDALFIFGAERRCVHDLIADTKVVQVAGR